MDSAGNVYLTGYTQSSNFPVVNAIQSSNRGGIAEAIVAKIDAEGSALVYSSYLGGSKTELGEGIAVDSLGSAYVIGITNSKRFPTTPFAFQPSLKGNLRIPASDVFVAKIASQTFVTVSRRTMGFGKHAVGTASSPRKLTVTNTGTGALTLNKISIGGAAPGDFAQTNNCGSSLAAGASCTITVTFTPTATGARKAALGISDSDPASPQAIALNGVGI